MENLFNFQPLSEKNKLEIIKYNIWGKDCPIALDRLRRVSFAYYDFNRLIQNEGEIIVLDAVARHVIIIFNYLYNIKFPIAQARPIEFYEGNDLYSMADNNTVCFNHRPITGGDTLSLHSYGVAIDLNPIENPYISFKEEKDKLINKAEIQPSAGINFINRKNFKKGMVEEIVNVFKSNGFTIWGGEWTNPIDWQHFQPPRILAQLLAVMTPSDAEELFKLYINHRKLLDNWPAYNYQLEEAYSKNPEKFMYFLKTAPSLLDLNPEEVKLFLIKNNVSS